MRKKVLVVDDDESIRKVTQKLLEQLGYEVETCASGEEALAVFEKRRFEFEVLVTDFYMSGMNGLFLARGVRAFRRGMPIVLMSANIGDVGLLTDVILLAKPFRLSELRAALASALRTS